MLARKILFKQWCWQWLEVYIKSTVKATTFYTTYIIPVRKHIIPFFGDKNIDSVTPVDVQEFFNEKSEVYSLEYLKKLRSLLYKIFDAAKDNKLCTESPMTSTLRIHSSSMPQEKQVWSKPQFITAWNFAKGHKHGLVILALMETGITRSEVLGLQWKDYNCENKVLHIEQGLVEYSNDSGRALLCEGLKNIHRRRSIPISTELNAYFSLLKNMQRFGGSPKPLHIFCNADGQPFWPTAWYCQIFCSFMRDLHEQYPDIPMLQTHELRHTRATLLSRENVDLFSIAKLLGHRNLDMLSKRYLHNDIDALRASLNVV